MTFKESADIIKLDFTRLVLIPSGGSGGISSDFEIDSKDFLKFAKEDLHSDDERGIVNALSNAKRSIDCQIDEIFETLGVNYLDLPKSLEEFVGYFGFKDDIPFKLKVIQGLNIAPSLIISKARTLRNKLEHFYKRPELNEVREAIDVAELFIRSVEGKFKVPTNDFFLTDEENVIEEEFNSFKNGYSIEFDFDKKQLDMGFTIEGQKRQKLIIKPDVPEFFAVIRLMNSIDDDYEIAQSCKVLAHVIKHQTPNKFVNGYQS